MAGAGQPELVVIAHREADLRAGGRVASLAPDVDTDPLNAVLERHGATMKPLFGLSEDRLRRLLPAAEPPSGSNGHGGPIQDLSLYYRVEAEEARLAPLAEEILAQDGIQAAYVKPPATVPSAVGVQPELNQM